MLSSVTVARPACVTEVAPPAAPARKRSGVRDLPPGLGVLGFQLPTVAVLRDKASITQTISGTFVSQFSLRPRGIARAYSRPLGWYGKQNLTLRAALPRDSDGRPNAKAGKKDPEPSEGSESHSFLARLLKQRTAAGAALRSYGVAAVISYGLFDAVTYSVSFLLALKGFVAAGKILTYQSLPQVLAITWGINNVSRPFRIAGALALAPIVDRFGTSMSRLEGGRSCERREPRDLISHSRNKPLTVGLSVSYHMFVCLFSFVSANSILKSPVVKPIASLLTALKLRGRQTPDRSGPETETAKARGNRP